MMKKGTAVAVLLTALLVLLGGCQKDDGGDAVEKLVVASDATWPPMEYVDANKEMVGFDIDLIRAVAEEGGFEVEIRNTAWDGIFAGLANGEYDAVISSVTITEDRMKAMDFSIPYVNAGQVLIVPQGSGALSLSDLEGQSAGAQIGTTGAIEIEKAAGVALKTYDEIGLAIADLANGRIAGVVCDGPIAADFVLQNEEYQGALEIVGEPFTDEYYGIAVKKGNERILEAVNRGLKAVQEKGLDKELEKKWLR